MKNFVFILCFLFTGFTQATCAVYFSDADTTVKKKSNFPQIKNKPKENASQHKIYIPRENKGVLLSASGSIMRAHMNYGKSYHEDTYARAYEGRLYFDRGGFIRLVAGMEYVPSTDLKPMWINIKSTYLDLGTPTRRRIVGNILDASSPDQLGLPAMAVRLGSLHAVGAIANASGHFTLSPVYTFGDHPVVVETFSSGSRLHNEYSV